MNQHESCILCVSFRLTISRRVRLSIQFLYLWYQNCTKKTFRIKSLRKCSLILWNVIITHILCIDFFLRYFSLNLEIFLPELWLLCSSIPQQEIVDISSNGSTGNYRRRKDTYSTVNVDVHKYGKKIMRILRAFKIYEGYFTYHGNHFFWTNAFH